jgi:glyoxylase I family protein
MMCPPTVSGAGGVRIVGADHVALRVADYDETVRFYTTKLGFQLEAEWTLGDDVPGVRLAYVRLGACMIELIGDGTPAALAPTRDLDEHLSRSGYIHLCLRVADLDATLRELRARDVQVFAEPFVVEPIGQRLAMIKDNSGNVIELAQAVEA